MTTVTHLAEKSDNNKLWSPEYCLRKVLEDLETGKIKISSLLVLYGWEDEADRHTGCYRAQCDSDKGLVLCHRYLVNQITQNWDK